MGQWQLSTFHTYQGGFPTAFGVQGGTGVPGAARRGPMVVGDPTEGVSGSHSSRLGGYFNTAAFARPANFAIGNLAPRLHTVRTPGMNNINLTLSKTFTLTLPGAILLLLWWRQGIISILDCPLWQALTGCGNGLRRIRF